jgi:hypothetical protein
MEFPRLLYKADGTYLKVDSPEALDVARSQGWCLTRAEAHGAVAALAPDVSVVLDTVITDEPGPASEPPRRKPGRPKKTH